jgi:hypothetical protein
MTVVVGIRAEGQEPVRAPCFVAPFEKAPPDTEKLLFEDELRDIEQELARALAGRETP